MGRIKGSGATVDPLQEIAREWLTVVGQLISDSRNRAIGTVSDPANQEKKGD